MSATNGEQRGYCLRMALRVARLAIKLERVPSARELSEHLGLHRRTAYRWAALFAEVFEDRTRPNGPRMFEWVERPALLNRGASVLDMQAREGLADSAPGRRAGEG